MLEVIPIYIMFEGNSVVKFTRNSASTSGAVDLYNTNVTFNKCTVIFDNNNSDMNGRADVCFCL